VSGEKICLIFDEGKNVEIVWKKSAGYTAAQLCRAGLTEEEIGFVSGGLDGKTMRAELAGCNGRVAVVSGCYPLADMCCVADALKSGGAERERARVFQAEKGEYAAVVADADSIPEVVNGKLPAEVITVTWEKIADAKTRLAAAEEIKEKTIERLMEEGVIFHSMDGVLICPDAEIGDGTEILPGTIIKSKVKIGRGCVIGPNTLIEESCIGDGCVINASQVYASVVKNGVRIGPFSHIRPHCTVEDGVKIGDFVEVKNSHLGEKTSVAHLTYIGDSDVGERVNFGCGCVTVNYDGFRKSRTVVEDDVFVGCNTNLVAPVRVEEGSFIAAGSTITDDVPAGALAIARARQTVKEGWQKKRMEEKKSEH